MLDRHHYVFSIIAKVQESRSALLNLANVMIPFLSLLKSAAALQVIIDSQFRYKKT